LKKKNSMSKTLNQTIPLTLLAVPSIIYIVIFNYIPLYGLLIPFKEFNFKIGLLNSPWVGFENFQYLFNSNKILEVVRNTISYNFTAMIVGTIISIMFALFLFELSARLVKIYQTILFFPYFMSWIIVAYLTLGFLDGDHGIINMILRNLGKEPVFWYQTPSFWPFIIVFLSVWKGMGYGTIIYYSALMAIDGEMYEAAKIDGANWLQQVFYISLPVLKPMIIIINIMAVGKIFYADFGLFYQVTLDSSLLYPTTDVIDTYVYRMLMKMGDFGMSGAAGFVQSVFGFILVLITNYSVKKITKESLF
jgi:putative aldouronate transport system permease protein